MGRERSSNTFGASNDGGQAVRAAQAVMNDLESGKDVSAAAVDAARDAMVQQVRTGTGALARQAGDGLTRLFARTPDPLARASLLGELVASGNRAAPVLSAVLEHHSASLKDFLTAEETAKLRELVDQPLEQRLVLAMVAGWLGRAAREDPMPPEPNDRPQAARETVRTRRLDESVGSSDGEPATMGDREKAWSSRARDTRLPEEDRYDAVMRMGPQAVPLLREMARNPSEHEFVASMLVGLGRTPGSREAVREAVARMAFDPSCGRMADQVSSALDGVAPKAGGKSGAVRDPGNGWLARALSEVSEQNILRAGAGRETIVIPMAFLRLAELRQRRSAAPATP